jgi:hypothetical protein
VLDLILALANEAAAPILPSRIADRTLSRDLGILYSRVDANLVNIASFVPLVELIVRNKPGAPTSNDADIWRTVFELVAGITPVTRPTVFEKAVLDTPLRSSSASQKGIEQTYNDTGRVFDNVGGFFERLRGRHSRIRWGISTESPVYRGSLERVARAFTSRTIF